MTGTEQAKHKPPPALNGLTSRRTSPPSSLSRGKTSAQVKTSQMATRTNPGKRSGSISHDSASMGQHCGRPLEAASILNNPRLQQVTGLHPSKLSRYNSLQPSRDELMRLRWVMSLPDPYPVKRPKGNF
ncbi:hypothetical protein F5Y05DRAFT_335454 [Hypoxylon sp. FL0543]|nr:hypothetical protein F5Y05DRAFT_335454 [Hypoxylon sp. FL0543]